MEKGKYAGTDKWPEAKAELLPHIGNFAPILVEAGRSQPIAKVSQAIEPARLLASIESRFEHTAFLKLASVLRARAPDNLVKATEADVLHAVGDLALQRDDLDGAKNYLETALNISIRFRKRSHEANALLSLGALALRRDDLDGAKNYLETACDISGQIGNRPAEVNALLTLGALALRRDDLDGAKTHLEIARNISVREAAGLVRLVPNLFRHWLKPRRTQLEPR